MRSTEQRAVAVTVIALMRGVIYRESDEGVWQSLARHQGPVRSHFGTIGVDVVIDDTEGYAYLRAEDDDQEDEPLPRLVRRRSLSYNVSLLLVLLRKRLLEFESSTGEGKLVVRRDELVDLLRIFLAESTNEARVIDQVDSTVRKVVELGFLRPLRGQSDEWEVRRVIKAFVDAQTLSDFQGRLAEYAELKRAVADE